MCTAQPCHKMHYFSSSTTNFACLLIRFVSCPPLVMDPVEARLEMIRKGAAVVVVLCTWMLVMLRTRSRPSITYAPMSAGDEERQHNLRFIYQSSDTQCVELLRTSRAPFFQLCDLFRNRELLKDTTHCTIEE